MNTQDREAIDHLFNKLRDAERQAAPREPMAENHIRARIAAQPGAPYLMAQTIVVQEQALDAAQARIAGLEDELAQRPAGGGFLSGLFGGGQSRRTHMPQHDLNGMGARAMPPMHSAGRPGGGFLAGAAQTAMGVAGGMLLGSMIGSALGGGEANAAEAPASQPETAPAADDAADFGGGEE